MKKPLLPFFIALAVIAAGGVLTVVLLLKLPNSSANAGELQEADYKIDTVIGSAASGVRSATSEDGSIAAPEVPVTVPESIALDEEPETETETEEPAAEQPVEEQPRFYKITTTNRITILRLREAPNLEAKILYKMPPGTPGYVIQRGNLWSYIVASTKDGLKTGYAFNGYLWFEEMDEADIPAEVRAVSVPDPWPAEGEGPSDFVGNPYGNDVGGSASSGPSSESGEASEGSGDSGSGSGSSTADAGPAMSASPGPNKGSELEETLDPATAKTLADSQANSQRFGSDPERAQALGALQQPETRYKPDEREWPDDEDDTETSSSSSSSSSSSTSPSVAAATAPEVDTSRGN